MHPFWNTKLGRLLIGGCGAQVGLLLTLGSLAIVVLFCSVCVFANVLSLGLTQDLSVEATAVPVQASSSSAEIELLRQKVNLLVNRVIFIRTHTPAVPVPPLSRYPHRPNRLCWPTRVRSICAPAPATSTTGWAV